ncbi:hypothetical protein LV779_36890 [Streptomyces thinghirensis]|nr:hypothetical protein [Streptomyces thinghirensis]
MIQRTRAFGACSSAKEYASISARSSRPRAPATPPPAGASSLENDRLYAQSPALQSQASRSAPSASIYGDGAEELLQADLRGQPGESGRSDQYAGARARPGSNGLWPTSKPSPTEDWLDGIAPPRSSRVKNMSSSCWRAWSSRPARLRAAGRSARRSSPVC